MAVRWRHVLDRPQAIFDFHQYAAHDRKPSIVLLVKIQFAGIEPLEKALPDFCGRSGILWGLRARSSVG